MPEFLMHIVIGNLNDYLESATQNQEDSPRITRRAYNLCVALVSFWEHAFDADQAALRAQLLSPKSKQLREVANTYKHFKATSPRSLRQIRFTRLRHIAAGGGYSPRPSRSRFTTWQGEHFHSLRDIPFETTAGKTTLNTLLARAVPEVIQFGQAREWIEAEDAETTLGDLEVLEPRHVMRPINGCSWGHAP